ncbi:MAG TPA: hypothetical protein VN088_00125, partial [Nocardioides sp.]|nr:hypothetical protein [Nocardioides sp.]
MARSASRLALIRAGFADIDRARAGLDALGPDGDALLSYLGRTADPDAALAALARLAAALGEDGP